MYWPYLRKHYCTLQSESKHIKTEPYKPYQTHKLNLLKANLFYFNQKPFQKAPQSTLTTNVRKSFSRTCEDNKLLTTTSKCKKNILREMKRMLFISFKTNIKFFKNKIK